MEIKPVTSVLEYLLHREPMDLDHQCTYYHHPCRRSSETLARKGSAARPLRALGLPHIQKRSPCWRACHLLVQHLYNTYNTVTYLTFDPLELPVTHITPSSFYQLSQSANLVTFFINSISAPDPSTQHRRHHCSFIHRQSGTFGHRTLLLLANPTKDTYIRRLSPSLLPLPCLTKTPNLRPLLPQQLAVPLFPRDRNSPRCSVDPLRASAARPAPIQGPLQQLPPVPKLNNVAEPPFRH